MCWSAEVSYTTAAIELVLLATMWASQCSRPWAKAFTPLGLTILGVELCEAVIWPHIADLGARLANSAECPWVNAALMTVISQLIFCQPIFVCTLALRCPDGATHPHETELRTIQALAVVAIPVFCLGLAITMATRPDDRLFEIDGTGEPAAPYGAYYATSCAYRGPHGHQLWQLGYRNRYSDLFPGAWGYFVSFFAACLLCYDKVEALFLFVNLGIFVVLAIVWQYVGEASSVWCWTGVTLYTFYNIFPHAKARLQIPDVLSWQELVSMIPPKACKPKQDFEPKPSFQPLAVTP